MSYGFQPIDEMHNLGKVINRYVLNQVSPGTTTIAGASSGNKHKIVGGLITLSVPGTVKFSDGVGDLSGPMDIAATGGFAIPNDASVPLVETAFNSPLRIVTTGGAARGIILYVTEGY